MAKRDGGGFGDIETGPSEMPPRSSPVSMRSIFWTFLKLGLSSFGGPVAHIGYFRAEFVNHRRWLDDRSFGDIVALCQFLPGPASSQAGFAIGMVKRGVLGGMVAWTAFTAPSAFLMIAAAFGVDLLSGPIAAGVIHGLKLVAVAVVAQAVWGMARTLAPDRLRSLIAVLALATIMLMGGGLSQLAILIAGATLGWLLRKPSPAPHEAALTYRTSPTVGWLALAIFGGLLLGLPAAGALTSARPILVADAFFRSGALVFGGGHVVLPLLNDEIVKPGWVRPDQFLAGYALAQALPGPLFAFAAYLGALLQPGPNGVVGSLIGLISIFLPGLLLVAGLLPFWEQLRTQTRVQAAMQGANASVVGILAATLYNPLWTSAVAKPLDLVVAAAAFSALMVWRVAPFWVVAACAMAGATILR